MSPPDLPPQRHADTAATASCPYCWSTVELTLDPGSGSTQSYVEDCAVCCQPWRVRVVYSDEGTAGVRLEREDG
jgi:hypothetical protein